MSLPHQAGHPFLAATHTLKLQFQVNPRTSVALMVVAQDVFNKNAQFLVAWLWLTHRTLTPCVVSRAAHAQHAAHRGDIEVAQMLLNEGVLQ